MSLCLQLFIGGFLITRLTKNTSEMSCFSELAPSLLRNCYVGDSLNTKSVSFCIFFKQFIVV